MHIPVITDPFSIAVLLRMLYVRHVDIARVAAKPNTDATCTATLHAIARCRAGTPLSRLKVCQALCCSINIQQPCQIWRWGVTLWRRLNRLLQCYCFCDSRRTWPGTCDLTCFRRTCGHICHSISSRTSLFHPHNRRIRATLRTITTQHNDVQLITQVYKHLTITSSFILTTKVSTSLNYLCHFNIRIPVFFSCWWTFNGLLVVDNQSRNFPPKKASTLLHKTPDAQYVRGTARFVLGADLCN